MQSVADDGAESGKLPLVVYRDEVSKIDDLQDHEQLALGGLLRILIRLDGSFSEAEEAHFEQVAQQVGTTAQLWAVVSRAAQELSSDDDVREVALRVERLGARSLIRETLEIVAQAETIEPAEQALLDWLAEAWGAKPED